MEVPQRRGRHAPGPAEALLPPVIGTMLEFRDVEGLVELRMLISGDTLLDRRLEAIPRRFPDVDVRAGLADRVVPLERGETRELAAHRILQRGPSL